MSKVEENPEFTGKKLLSSDGISPDGYDTAKSGDGKTPSNPDAAPETHEGNNHLDQVIK